MIEQLQERVNGNAALVARGRYVNVVLMLGIGDACWRLDIVEGRIRALAPGPFVMPSSTFSISAPAAEWEKFWQAVPPPGSNDLFALLRRGVLQLAGDLHPLMANLMYFKGLLASLRPSPAVPAVPDAARAQAVAAGPAVARGARIEAIVGRYAQIDIAGRAHRIYWEEAGQGIPLLCLHTAGSDGRQYRALLNDPELTKHFRVIAYDMPWHGKSSPPQGWQNETYQLGSDAYVGQVLDIMTALELDRPAIMGCSIGGRIVLRLAEQHPEKFRAIIGLQSSTHVDPYYDTSWLHRPDVHGGEVCGAVAYGLTAPTSPDEPRWETVWHYMQGGPGIFRGDMHFYKIDGDVRERTRRIDTSKCPLYLLTGDYDFSCSPADTRATADLIGSVEPVTMRNMGHFPMSENPEQFIAELGPVLETIRAAG